MLFFPTRTASPTERPTERPEGLEALEGMATGLYSEAFNAIVALINMLVFSEVDSFFILLHWRQDSMTILGVGLAVL